MKTVPLTDLKKGMLIFSEDRNLMARITSVKAKGFDFRVENGGWGGTMTDAGMLIHAPRETMNVPDVPSDTFRRVTALTKDECKQWYVDRFSVRHLIRDDADIADPTPEDGKESRVFEMTVTMKVMGEDVSGEAFANTLRTMGPREILREMDQGDFLGQVSYGTAERIEDGQVAHRAAALGSDETFFPDFAHLATTEPDDTAGRILRAQMGEGLSNAGLEAASRAFIERMGLSHAYAAFLESGEALKLVDPEDIEDDEDLTPF